MTTPSAKFYYPGNEPWNRQAQEDFFKAFSSAFPDHLHTMDEQIAEGDKVMTRFTLRGTHYGELPGIAPTGKQITVEMAMIDHVVGGKIQEHRVFYDMLGLLQQLGAVPG
jgi:predicted ester cyclase